MRPSCTGAILLGGQSSRMGGGAPKHELRLQDGRTMLSYVMEEMERACSRVVLVHGFVSAEAGEGGGGGGKANIVRDLRPNAGPLGGIEALLASGIDSQYLVCPCDLPLLTSDLLRRLIDGSDESLASVFQIEAAVAGREVEPLPARIRAEVLPIVRRLLNRQQRSVWKLMQEIQPHVVLITAREALQLHNVNTPEDYEVALQRLRTGRT